MSLRQLAALLLTVVAVSPAAAHPHLWIDASLAIEVAEGKVTGIAVSWVFDPLYSEIMRQDFDTDRDSQLSEAELAALAATSAAGLRAYSFFIHLRIGQTTLPVSAVDGLIAEVIEGGLVRYRFHVPLPEPTDPRVTSVAVGLFDLTYYVDFELTGENVALDPASGCRIGTRQDLAEPIYYGSVYPTYMVLECD